MTIVSNQPLGDTRATSMLDMSLGEELRLLKLGYEVLRAKNPIFKKRWRYYDGNHTLVWSTDRVQSVFKGLSARFIENWCRVVINVTHDRINLEHFSVKDKPDQSTKINDFMDASGLLLDADEIHREALVTGESFVVTWKDQDGEVEAYHHESTNVHLFYHPDNARRKWFAIKWYWDLEDHLVLTLFLRDSVITYRSQRKVEQLDTFDPAKFARMDEEPNPFGEIPVFHFRLDDRGTCELDDVIPIQDMLNKTLCDMMVTGEFAAFPQRWVVTNAEFEDGRIPMAPFTTTKFPPADKDNTEGTQVGQWDAADMTNFIGSIEHLASSVSVLARIPKHYLYQQGGDPSGEALIAMETPLTKKVEKHLKRFKRTWREFVAFYLLLDSSITPERLQDIEVTFSEPRTLQPLTQAQTRQINTTAGIPILTLLRMEGWSDAEMEQLVQDQRTMVTPTPVIPAPTGGLPRQQIGAQNRQAVQDLVSSPSLEQGINDMLSTISEAVLANLKGSGVLEKVLGNG